MAKLVLSDLVNLQNEVSAVGTINLNSNKIEAAVENTLSRDGTAPNQMEAPLDMNSQQIINLPVPGTLDSPVRVRDLAPNAAVTLVTTLNSIAQLQTLNIDSGVDFVELAGYYAAGDGGAHLRVRDDTGDIISADGAKWKVSSTEANIRMYGARGDGVTDDGPAIRLACSFTPKGGTLRIPYGSWYVNSVANGSVFNLASDTVISIIGDGWSIKKDGSYANPTGTIIKLGPAIPDDADVIRLYGTDVNFGSRFKDFAIVCSNSVYGTPVGRHGIFIDATGTDDFYQSNLIVDHVFVDNMKTGYSFKSTAGASSNTGGLAFSSIGGKSQLMNIDLAYVGDGVKVEGCVLGFNATDDARNIGVRFENVTGAAGTQIIGNVIANYYKMVVCDGGVKPVIRDNEFELGNIASGGGVLIDMNGANSLVLSPTITGNTLSQNSTFGDYTPIRIDRAQAADIYDNRIAIPNATNHIVITANAGATHVGHNYYTVAGATNLDGIISDSGLYTRVDGCLVTNYPGTVSGHTVLKANSSVAATGIVELPNTATTDTLVARDTADTLTNKTLTSPKVQIITNNTPVAFLNFVSAPQGILVGSIAVENNYGFSTPPAEGIFSKGGVAFGGSTSGSTLLKANAVASGTLTLPTGTDTLVGKTTTDALSNTKVTSVKIKKFSASGTYTPSTGLLYAVIECVGPGGAGGGTFGAAADLKAGGGGGSGGYSKTVVSAATIGASQTVTVGTGGTGVSNAAGNNGSGATSVGTLCVANAGGGGALCNGTTAFGAGGAGAAVWAGAGANDLAVGGAAGAYGPLYFTPANAPTLVLGGPGGPSFLGGGAPGPAQSSGLSAPGTNALIPGAGGSGGISYTVATNTAGGSGADGRVIITEFINQ